MSLVRTVGFCACFSMAFAGCRTAQQAPPASASLPPAWNAPSPVAPSTNTTAAVTAEAPPPIAQAAYFAPQETAPLTPELLPPATPQTEFCLSQFLTEVQARNPSLQAMMAAAQAAAERYPQVVSLEDPM